MNFNPFEGDSPGNNSKQTRYSESIQKNDTANNYLNIPLEELYTVPEFPSLSHNTVDQLLNENPLSGSFTSPSNTTVSPYGFSGPGHNSNSSNTSPVHLPNFKQSPIINNTPDLNSNLQNKVLQEHHFSQQTSDKQSPQNYAEYLDKKSKSNIPPTIDENEYFSDVFKEEYIENDNLNSVKTKMTIPESNNVDDFSTDWDSLWFKDVGMKSYADTNMNLNNNDTPNTQYVGKDLESIASGSSAFDSESQFSSSVYSGTSYKSPSVALGHTRGKSISGTRNRRLSIGEQSTNSSRLYDTRSVGGLSAKSRVSRDDEKLHRKRSCHNEVEKRRRDLIKYKIKELNTIVPDSIFSIFMKNKTIKPKKRTILCGSIEYLRVLENILTTQATNKKSILEKIREYENLFRKNDLNKTLPTNTRPIPREASVDNTKTPTFEAVGLSNSESFDYIKSEKDLNNLLLMSENQAPSKTDKTQKSYASNQDSRTSHNTTSGIYQQKTGTAAGHSVYGGHIINVNNDNFPMTYDNFPNTNDHYPSMSETLVPSNGNISAPNDKLIINDDDLQNFLNMANLG